MNENWIVVTTINPPTDAIERINALCAEGWSAVVVGDCKTPSDWACGAIEYLSVDRQRELYPELSELIPYNHYCRKNLGYLFAIANGAECILETDDDNIPYRSFGQDLNLRRSARLVGDAPWINVYKYFTGAHIWPRGLPLDEIGSIGRLSQEEYEGVFPIQQYLADLDPDVDAVYRLVTDAEVTFDQNRPVALEAGSWVPFNSQNTLFFRTAFPLLYLPCHVSFRMTDIWRSFVAQQALWIREQGLAFLPATVKQLRNEHDLMRDFADEVPGYLENKRIAALLEEAAAGISPQSNLSDVAKTLWSALKRGNIVPERELPIIDAWLAVLERVQGN